MSTIPKRINCLPHVTPDTPKDEQPVIGLIGMGAMGKMYAKYLSEAGWKKIHVCDLPSKYDDLRRQYANSPSVTPLPDGHAVSRSSDFIMYSVEAEFIERVVAQYGPSTKMNAIVAGQTSVKAPEKAAFEAHLPADAHIVSCHSLHGPTVSPVGQPLVLIKHRASDDALTLVESLLIPLGSRFVHLSYEEHDRVTANTQAVTHAAFLSMGTAWASARSYPWEQGLYVGGIETAKVNLTLRIYSNAWHVYAGLAILNPSARVQIDQYAKSATELFKLMLHGGNGDEAEKMKFRDRVESGREVVFGDWGSPSSSPAAATAKAAAGEASARANEKENVRERRKRRRPILLSEDVLDRFGLGQQLPPSPVPASPFIANGTLPSSPSPPSKYCPNSHLSLLAMVDCWAHLNINPYHHLTLAATPIFRLFLGVAEYLFLTSSVLESAMHSAIYDTWHRSDDLEFVIAARGWSQCVSFGSFEVYRKRFEETRAFFEPRFDEAGRLGSEMIKAIMESEVQREEEAGQKEI